MSREVLLDEQTFCSLAFIVGQGVLLRLLCPWDYSTLISGSSALYSQQQQRPSLEGPGYTPEVSPHCSSTRNSPLGADFLMKLGLPGTVLAFIFLSSGFLFVCLFLLQVKNPLTKKIFFDHIKSALNLETLSNALVCKLGICLSQSLSSVRSSSPLIRLFPRIDKRQVKQQTAFQLFPVFPQGNYHTRYWRGPKVWQH